MDSKIQNVLFFRALNEEEKCQPISVLADGELADVVLRPSVYAQQRGNVSNVPYRFKFGWWYEWGYMGNGPCDTAINILYHFSGQDEQFARAYTLEFIKDVLEKIPNRTAISISKNFILSWIEVRREKPSSFGNFELGQFSPNGHTWEFGSYQTVSRQVKIE